MITLVDCEMPKELIDFVNEIFEVNVAILDYDLDRIYLSNGWTIRMWNLTNDFVEWTLFHEMDGKTFERRSGMHYFTPERIINQIKERQQKEIGEKITELLQEIPKKVINEFKQLTEQEQKYLLAFIEASYRQRATRNNDCTSYGLKHEFERWALGFYVTNDQFKGAMLKSGYKVYNQHDTNWNFNIAKHKYYGNQTNGDI